MNGDIDAAAMKKFVDKDSAFGLEMRVMKCLSDAGAKCSHSGTYIDPVTDKARQYDVQAMFEHGPSTLGLAVECKNFEADHPLLISSVRRTASDAYVYILAQQQRNSQFVAFEKRFECRYKVSEMVGKKAGQVKRDKGGSLVGDDVQTFEKISQGRRNDLENRQTVGYAWAARRGCSASGCP